MSKKQTAVEWLSEQFDSIVELYPSQFERVNRAIDTAKEMEREQIKSAFNIGELMAHDYFYGNDDCAENYYNETYGGNK